MRKFIKIAILSAVSTATVFPSNTTFADTTSVFDERITRTTTVDPFFDHGRQIQTRTHINRHQTRHEKQTHNYTHIERHKHVHQHFVERNDSGDTLAAGILGLAAGTLLGNVLKKPEQPQIIYQVAPPQHQVIYHEVPQTQVVYQAPTVVTPQNPQWTSGWVQYCKAKYRSFNPKTGTFKGYDGKEHFCYAPVTISN
ncbi:BA14K family protein [Bartonella sp. CB189]|uniref:BA14K family protein n=1 Tax=Bartonella sp. CB189 TaxID=3112254 RepID=UPI002F9681FC